LKEGNDPNGSKKEKEASEARPCEALTSEAAQSEATREASSVDERREGGAEGSFC
jgi:hypothetical protein